MIKSCTVQPWYKYFQLKGELADPVGLRTKLMENLLVDLAWALGWFYWLHFWTLGSVLSIFRQSLDGTKQESSNIGKSSGISRGFFGMITCKLHTDAMEHSLYRWQCQTGKRK